MKPLKSMLLIVTVLSFNSLNSQTQSILYCGENSTVQNNFYKNNGLQNVYILYQDHFVKGEAMTFDKAMMETSMDKVIPDKSAAGYGILDWEGNYFNQLVGWYSSTPENYKKIMNGFISALHYAKILRPNIKWSYYNLPPNCWTSYTAGYDAWLRDYIPILKEEDYLAPSQYLLYDGNSVASEFSTQTITSTIKYVLDLGRKLNKPVYVFVWHRYHPNSSTNGNMLISVTNFADYINRMINIESSGRKPDGIVWWNCDNYIYSARGGDAVLTAEFQNVTNYDTYEANLLQKYLDAIKSFF